MQHQERQRTDDQCEGERQFGQSRQLMTARRIQPEPLLQQVADRKTSLRRLACDGANGQIAEPAEQTHDTCQHELLGSEARKRHIAQQCRDDDADSDDPQRYLEPARFMA